MATNTNFQTPAQQLANAKELRIFGRGLGLSPDEVDELVTNFKAFDVDGSATVNRNELEKLFGKMLRGCVADSLIQKWVKASFKKADQNSNKELDILEFLKLYMSDFVHHVRDAKKQAAAKKQEVTEEDNGSSSRDLDFSAATAAAAAPPAPVLLNLKLVKDGAAHALSLPQDSTLASLRAEVQAKTGVPAERQTLVFKGAELPSNTNDAAATLSSVGLKDGDSVELLQKLRVGVRGPDGKTAFLDANTSTSVAELKALILRAKLTSAKAEDSLVLSHKGKPLSDNAATLAGLGVKDGETLDLAEKLSLTVHIPGRGALTLTATSSVTAAELLALIHAATGLATDRQALFHDGTLLDGKAGVAGLRGTLSLGTTRTLLFVRKVTRFGEFVHLRGGQGGSRKPVRIAYTNVLNKATTHGNELSWAQATGSDWTTKPGSNEFHAPERHVGALGFGNDPDNRKGDHYWKFDVDMPDARVGDWIEFQAELQTLSGSIESEGDVKQPNAPFPAPHHYARVGYVTYVNFGEGGVESYPITF